MRKYFLYQENKEGAITPYLNEFNTLSDLEDFFNIAIKEGWVDNYAFKLIEGEERKYMLKSKTSIIFFE